MGKKPRFQESVSTEKRPHAAHIPHVKKTAAAPEAINYQQMKPVWRMRMLQTEDPYGCHKLDSNTALQIRQRLGDFETMTWGEILGKQHHAVPFEDLSKEARDRVTALKLEQNEEFISLHLTGKKRIWGLREGAVLHLIFWDPGHEICPSPKKHT